MSCKPGELCYEGEKRRRALAVLALMALIFVALSGVSFLDSRGQAVPSAVDYAGVDAVAGKRVFQAYNCMGCHTIVGNGAYFGPDLTKLYGHAGPAWLAVDHARYNREWAYGQVQPRILIERMFLIDGSVPWDYRLFTFGGKVSHIAVDIRQGGEAFSCTYSADWKKLPFYDPDYYPLYRGEVERPRHLERMIALAQTLGRDLDFVRVDLYAGGDEIYVGELTLYPGGGFERFDPPEYDRIIGDRWNLAFQTA